jgi:signal transduction histidine kinase
MPGDVHDERASILKTVWYVLAAAAAVAGLWLTSLHSYLLFHVISEIFGIVIAVSVFIISWSSRNHPEARPFVFLGISYISVAILELVHVLSYQGMSIFQLGTNDYATKLWVSARGVQALASLAFAILLRRRKTPPHSLTFLTFAAVTSLLLLSIFLWKVFPLCFVEGLGVTTFKKVSEFVISGIFLAVIILTATVRHTLSRRVKTYLAFSFGLTIASELMFTLYKSAYGIENLVGHLLMIASFFFSCQALIVAQLKRRIGEIEELEAAKAALEKSEADLRQANLSKDRFFSILAHDLKNPIGGLFTLSELLTCHYDKLEQGRIRELCGLIHDGTKQAMELLESILQWARAHTRKMEWCPSTINLHTLCARAIEHVFTASSNKEVSIVVAFEDCLTAYADQNMILTVVRNLLSNAVKFTPRGGRVELTAAEREGFVELSVSDTGVGMTREEIEKLFRIDVHFSLNGTEQERGNGLGLVICRELVALNHGTISVASAQDAGSTFVVRLPRDAPPKTAPVGLKRP